jgi:two-component system, LytTR family, sensor kinase
MYFFTVPLGIGISHLYRNYIVRSKLLERSLPVQISAMIVFSILKALLFFILSFVLWKIFNLNIQELNIVFVMESVINFTVIFSIWNIIYFGFHYFQNYKRTEIDSLRYLAASKESQLMSLKAQLNPHFIFNCMNSIRALIDEDPAKAKDSVTRLSNILRTTLLLDKKKEISLKEEVELVNNYLDLEHIRYEERLNYSVEIDPGVLDCLLPPFIIQSQVENAIKHGISRIPGKGHIRVQAMPENDTLHIQVSNTGSISSKEPLTGVGFKNSIQRLALLYGQDSNINIREQDNLVVVDIQLPLKRHVNLS